MNHQATTAINTHIVLQSEQSNNEIASCVNNGRAFCGHKIQALNSQHYSYLQSLCHICLETFFIDKPITKYQCGHIIHQECSDKNILSRHQQPHWDKNLCVVCRQETDQIINYQSDKEYFKFECVDCTDIQCNTNKLQEKPQEINFNLYFTQIKEQYEEPDLDLSDTDSGLDFNEFNYPENINNIFEII